MNQFNTKTTTEQKNGTIQSSLITGEIFTRFYKAQAQAVELE